MDEATFKARTRGLALDAIRLVALLPRSMTNDVIGRQLVRCATSVGANYRAACRGRSTADVIAKLSIVEEEADETCYWLDLLQESEPTTPPTAAALAKEADEILRMTVASIKTLRSRSPARTR